MQSLPNFELITRPNNIYAWQVRPNGHRSMCTAVAIDAARDLIFFLEHELLKLVVIRAEDGSLYNTVDIPYSHHDADSLFVEESRDRVVIPHLCSRALAIFDLKELNQENPQMRSDSLSKREFSSTAPFYGYSAAECGMDSDRNAIDQRRFYEACIILPEKSLYLYRYQIYEDGEIQPWAYIHKKVKMDGFLPWCVCFDNLGRVIVGEIVRKRLRVFDISGREIASYYLDHAPSSVAFDFRRGRIVVAHKEGVLAIECNTILADTKRNIITAYDFGTREERAVMYTMLILRQVIQDSSLSLLPNEVLFLIFEAMVGL